MTMTLAEAASQLAEVLRAENAALLATDLAAAAAMLSDKQTAAEEFAQAREAARAAEEPAEGEILAELLDLAEQNRILLARGITVQGRLIGLMARAAADGAQAELGAYGSRGAPRHAAGMPAIAFASRA